MIVAFRSVSDFLRSNSQNNMVYCASWELNKISRRKNQCRWIKMVKLQTRTSVIQSFTLNIVLGAEIRPKWCFFTVDGRTPISDTRELHNSNDRLQRWTLMRKYACVSNQFVLIRVLYARFTFRFSFLLFKKNIWNEWKTPKRKQR